MPSGTRLKKVDKATADGVESGFFKDDENQAPIIERLNLSQNQENWFSLKIESNYLVMGAVRYFGERNEHNKPHGRGIGIYSTYFIRIGYFNNGGWAPGNYLTIWSDGQLDVGECYLKDGKKWDKGTLYEVNGNEEKFDRAL